MKLKMVITVLFILALVIVGRWETKTNEDAKVFTTDAIVGSDEYYIDSISFIHPGWSYDMCEDALFLSDSVFTAKYGE